MIDNIDESKILIIIGIFLCALVIAGIIVSYIVFSNHQKQFDSLLKDASNSIRVYVLDLENNKLSYFNRSKLRNRYTIDITNFYNHFPYEERDELIDWIHDLLDKEKDTVKFKEMHVISKHRKNPLFSLLEVEKINYEKQLIYINSYLIKSTITKRNKKDNVYHLTTQELFNKAIDSSSSTKGITFAYRFFDKRNVEEDISRLIYLQFVNIFNAYVTSNRLAVEYGTHHIVVSDLRITSLQQLSLVLTAINADINTYLTISSLQDKIGFTVGIAENRHFIHEPEKLVNTVVALADAAKEDGVSKLIYEKGKKVEGSDNDTYRTEVERIIRDKKLIYTYRPIIDMDRCSIIGYQSYVEPQDSFFGSINELKSYALRTEDDRTLFATIARNVITRFAQEKDGDTLRLFFPINNLEKNYVNRTLAYIENINDTHIVLVYSEQELVDMPDTGDDALVNEIRTFKSKGYEIGLALNDNDLTLNSSIYGSFDYYIINVDANLKVGNKYSQRSLYTFRGLVEKLLKYHRPIIASDIPSWDSVELIDKLGINLVSSEVIAPKDENVLPIPSKSLIKIQNIKK